MKGGKQAGRRGRWGRLWSEGAGDAARASKRRALAGADAPPGTSKDGGWGADYKHPLRFFPGRGGFASQGQHSSYGFRIGLSLNRPRFVGADLLNLRCHVSSSHKVRVTARNVSLSTVDLPAAALHVHVVNRRVG